MSKIPLQLSPQNESTGQRMRTEPTPLSGWLAVGFGLLGVFGPAVLFTPLGLLFSIIALLRGQGSWAFAGLFLVILGFVSSPLLMGIVGFGALFMIFDWQEYLRPFYDTFGGGTTV